MPDRSNRAKQNVATVKAIEERLGLLEAEAIHDRLRAGARLRELRTMRDDIRGVLGFDLLGPVEPVENDDDGKDDDAIQRADEESDAEGGGDGSRGGEKGRESVPAE